MNATTHEWKYWRWFIIYMGLLHYSQMVISKLVSLCKFLGLLIDIDVCDLLLVYIIIYIYIYLCTYIVDVSTMLPPPTSKLSTTTSLKHYLTLCQSLHDLGSASYRVARAATYGLKLGLLGVAAEYLIDSAICCLFIRKDGHHRV